MKTLGKIIATAFASMLAVCCLCACSGSASTSGGCIGKHYTIQVNGVSLYYEVAGQGKPVVLCHGNGGSHKDLSTEISQLVEAGYKVYALDSRGQGANDPLDEYHYTDMADDVYEFINALNLGKPAFYGWSDGGIIGLELEIRHPNTVSALAVSGANLNPEALGLMFSLGTSAGNALTGDPLYDMILTEPDISTDELGTISVPTLVTAGTKDIVSVDHTTLIADSISNAELKILEGEDHMSYIQGSSKMGELLIDFLQRNGY